jgi:hypothetical protein
MIKPGIAMAAITILAASFPAISVARHEQVPDAQRSLNLVGGIMDSRCAIEGSHEKDDEAKRTKEFEGLHAPMRQIGRFVCADRPGD